MKWYFKIIVIAAAAVNLVLFCTEAAAQEELSSEEKIKIIEEIVETKLKEAKGGDAKSDVLKAIAAKFPLDPTDTPEYLTLVKQLEEETRKKYPVPDKELDAKYMAIAENSYPLYKPGDNVTVVYLLAGKSFTVSGLFYRQDASFVWVGSKKIPRRDLAKDYALRFDSDRVNQVRRNYVQENVRRYQQEKKSYLENLKRRNTDRMHMLRGEIEYEKTWSTARAIALQKYASAAERQDKLIAESIRKAQDCSNCNEEYKILEGVIRQYPNCKSRSSIENRLQEMKGEWKRKDEIRQQLQGIWQLQFSEKRPQWQSISRRHYAVEQALYKARSLQEEASYDQAIAEVEKIISREPQISSAAGAQNLLQTLKQQREELRQEQRRLAESREAVKNLSINDSSQRAQIVIRKKINVSASATVFIFPMERKKEIKKLHNIIYNILYNYLSYKKQYSEGKRLADAGNGVNVTSVSSFSESSNLLDQAESHMKQAQTALQLFEKYHNEAKNILLQITMQSMNNTTDKKQRLIALESGPVTLSNIRGPIILFAFEYFNFRMPDEDFNSFQSWYMEYTPTSQTVNWDLK